MSPIPVALCGKSASMAGSFTQEMLPEYEITHVFHSPEAVHAELPALLRGESMKPQSGLGTNAESEKTQAPKAIIVGAGFSKEELEDVRGCDGGDSVPWLYPDPIKSAGSMIRGPWLLSHIATRAKQCMQSNGLVEGKEDEVRPTVWRF